MKCCSSFVRKPKRIATWPSAWMIFRMPSKKRLGSDSKSAKGSLEPSRSQAYDLTDAKLTGSDHCPINAREVVVHADHGLHHLGVGCSRVRIEIEHRATFVSQGDAYSRTGSVG